MAFNRFNISKFAYFEDKQQFKKVYLKYNFSFYVWKKTVFSDWLESFACTIFCLRGYILNVSSELSMRDVFEQQQGLNILLIDKQIKNQLFSINCWDFFSNKLLYAFLHCFFFTSDWASTKRIFRARRRLGKYDFKIKNVNNRLMYNFSKNPLMNKGLLSISFSKRNMFLNLSTGNNRSLLVTTLRKLGFLGRRRREYTSIFGAVRILKQSLRKYKIKKLAIIYKGWNRFRIAVKNSLKYRDQFKVPILYIKFAIKIPHNGCRLNKKKRKKRKKKVWLRKKKPYIDKKYIKI